MALSPDDRYCISADVSQRSIPIRIAVASQNFRTVTGHAGKCRRFLVFEAEQGTAPREVDRLDLPQNLSIREFTGDASHPLDTVKVVIVAGAGPGFVARMAARGVEVAITSQRDPRLAVAQHCAGTLPRAQSSTSIQEGALHAAEFLKAMANDSRLMLLCALSHGEKSVSELEHSVELSQSRVSQQLARLRRAGLIRNRPLGATVYYSLSSPHVRMIVDALYQAYCKERQAHAER